MSGAPRREPQRTCVGCRLRAAKADLVRVVREAEGRVWVDRSGRAPGRGAYVHPREACLWSAVRRGALARALRTSLPEAEVGRLVSALTTTLGDER